MAPVLKFKLLNPDARLPQYAHETDAAFDLYSPESVTISPGDRYILKLGLASEIPVGWYVQLHDRSSFAAKYGLHTLGGVIDAGYRGEWGLIVTNLGKDPIDIEQGDRVGQGILHKIHRAKIVQTEELSETERGEGGFGSTGRK